MKRLSIAAIALFVIVALCSVPAMAQPGAALAPLPSVTAAPGADGQPSYDYSVPAAAIRPAGTASPRDWDKLVSENKLLDTAVKAESAILIDEKTNTVLFEKNADAKQYPASITKIMTAYLALESGKSLTEKVTVGKLPAMESGAVSMDLKEGETLTLEDLVNVFLIKSANDAGNAIAIYLAGSVEAFIDMMNAKAQELGMTNTHYVTTNGLHDAEHYTSARDMAKLAMAARKIPEFKKIVMRTSYTVKATNKHSSKRLFEGHNALVMSKDAYYYTYATGIKTGYHSKVDGSGGNDHTYVSSAEKDNMSLVAVVLKDGKNEKWSDAITMFEYGFKYYDTLDLKQLLVSKTVPPMDVENAAGSDPGLGSLQLIVRPITPDAYMTGLRDEIGTLTGDPALFEQKIEFTKKAAPIAKDEAVGKVTYLYNGEVKLECELLASRDVKEMPTPAPTIATAGATANTSTNGNTSSGGSAVPGTSTPTGGKPGGIGSIFLWLGVIVLVLLAAGITIRLVNMQRRNRKYSQYNYRQGGNGTKMRR